MTLNEIRAFVDDDEFTAALNAAEVFEAEVFEAADDSSSLEVLTITAECLSRLGRPGEAAAAQERAVRFAEEQFGGSSQQSLEAELRWVGLLSAAGDHPQAISLAYTVLAQHIDLFGRDDRRSLIAKANQAACLVRSEKWVGPQELDSVLDRWRVLDPSYEDLAHLEALNVQSKVLVAIAVRDLRHYVGFAAKSLGDEHPVTLAARDRLERLCTVDR